MAEMNTAEQMDPAEYVSATELNTYPLADVFVAVGPARVVAEGVTVGPVVTDNGEWFLIRFEGHAGPLKRTEAEALEAAAPQIRRHVARIEDNRHRAHLASQRAAEKAARIAACPGHVIVSREVGRCLHWIGCSLCGDGATVSSDD